MTGQLMRLELKLKAEQSKNDKLTEVAQGMVALHEKMKLGFQPIESTLSCLSCLEYLSEPNQHTLVCGHSICAKVRLLLLATFLGRHVVCGIPLNRVNLDSNFYNIVSVFQHA